MSSGWSGPEEPRAGGGEVRAGPPAKVPRDVLDAARGTVCSEDLAADGNATRIRRPRAAVEACNPAGPADP